MFSINMVMFLFFTIAVMIFERYINKSYTRKASKSGVKVNAGDNIIDRKFTQSIGDIPKSMSMHLDPSKTRDS